MIPETFLDMKRALYENDEEGNLYNNLFFQVKVETQLESKSYLKSISRLTENIIKAVKMMENIVIFIIML